LKNNTFTILKDIHEKGHDEKISEKKEPTPPPPPNSYIHPWVFVDVILT